MQIPPVTSATTNLQHLPTAHTTAQNEKKSALYVSDIVTFNKQPASLHVGPGIITLGS